MTTVKLHNVFHETWGDDISVSAMENRLEGVRKVESVRIAKGYTNSPIYVTLDSDTVSLRTIKITCRRVVRSFGHVVDGVDIDGTISDSNLRLKSMSPEEKHERAQKTGEIFEGERWDWR